MGDVSVRRSLSGDRLRFERLGTVICVSLMHFVWERVRWEMSLGVKVEGVKERERRNKGRDLYTREMGGVGSGGE